MKKLFLCLTFLIFACTPRVYYVQCIHNHNMPFVDYNANAGPVTLKTTPYFQLGTVEINDSMHLDLLYRK